MTFSVGNYYYDCGFQPSAILIYGGKFGTQQLTGLVYYYDSVANPNALMCANGTTYPNSMNNSQVSGIESVPSGGTGFTMKPYGNITYADYTVICIP